MSARDGRLPEHRSVSLSLCLVVRDEEKAIAACLRSAADLTDQIVVVDTGSIDRTPEIAASFGAEVYSHPWNDDFSDARNSALAHASCDWVLFLDADERLDDSARAVIANEINAPGADAYELVFYNYADETSPTPKVIHRTCRLFKNNPQYCFQGRVHERIVPSIANTGGVIRPLDAIVHHNGYSDALKERKNKREIYVRLLEAEMADRPDDPYVLRHMAAAYCADGEFERALPLLEQQVSMGTAAGEAYSLLANCYCELERYKEALDSADRADGAQVRHPEIEFSRGRALLALQEYDHAESAFREALRLGQLGEWTGDPSAWGSEALHGLACACFARGDYATAADLARQILSEEPEHDQASRMLREIDGRTERPSMSACMIVRNEEEFLDDCLDSVRAIADEIVIVDTGSTDRTIEIAEAHGAIVHRFAWNDNFSDARNVSIEHATCDWILILDADERLDPAAIETLRRAVRTTDVDAWQLIQRSRLGDSPDSAVGQCATCRLFRNRPEYRYRGPIHEHILHAIRENDGVVRTLDAVIHHLGYQPGVAEIRNKQDRFVRMLEAALEDEPDNLYYMQTLAAAHCAAGHYDTALPYLRQAADRVNSEDDFGAQVFCGLSTVLSTLERPEEALDAIDQAQQATFEHPTLYYNRGNALSQLGRYDEAIAAYSTAVEMGPQRVWNGDMSTFGYQAYLGMAAAYEELEDLKSAEAHYRTAIELNGGCAGAHNNLGRVYAALGQAAEAIDCFTRAIELEPASPTPYFNAGDVLYALGNYGEAATLYQAGLERQPDHAPGYFALGNCWFRMGAHEPAAAIYRHVLTIDPNHGDARANLALAEEQLAA